MINISTSCQHCIFAKYENNKQTGCHYSVPELFSDAGAEVKKTQADGKEFYIINRVCMYRRHETPEIDVEKAILPKLNVVVIHKDQEYCDLINTLNNINSINLASESVKKIIVCHENTDFKKMISTCKKNSKIPTDIVMMIDKLGADAMYDEAFKRASNGYVMFINSGDLIEKDTVEVIDYAINKKMQQVVCISEYPEVYMSVLYKHINGNKLENIKAKIDKLAELNDTKKFNWSQLRDQYISRNK